MLQIKNMLGGGKPNAPYAWAKYNTIENPIYYINPSFTAKVITAGSVFEIVTSSFDASKVDTSFFEGFKFDVNTVNLSVYKENEKYYISKGGNLSSPREFTYDPTTMRFNINNLSDSIGTKLSLNGGNYTGNKPTGEYEIVADSLIEYIIDDSPNKYPNGEVHTDGFFYRYAPEGLYAWKKNEIGSELKVLNKRVSTLPYNFYGGSAVMLNGEIHILGGADSTTKHYKWDGTSWTSVSTLPYNFCFGAAVVLNGEIHIFGSSYSSSYYKYHYKWNGSSWISVSTLPYAFYNGTAVVLNGEIHILGSGDSNCDKLHYKWDGSSWTSVSTLPYSFSYASAVVLNNEIHILGSYDSSSYTKHYKFDGSSWTSVSTLPYNFCQGSAVVLDSEIYILGGRDNTTKHYKWDGNSWTSVSTLPYNFIKGSAVVFDSGIHILGSDNSSYYTAHYLTIGYVDVYTFLDYVVSDKETAYPDGGEKGGYWYEKVCDLNLSSIGCTKYEMGSITPSSNTVDVTVTHSMGIKPKYGIMVREAEASSGYTISKVAMMVFEDDYCGAYAFFSGGQKDENYNGTTFYKSINAFSDTKFTFSGSGSYKFFSGFKYNYILLG